MRRQSWLRRWLSKQEKQKASPLRSHTLPWQLRDFNGSKEVTIDVIINICWTVFLSFFLKVVIVKAQLEDTMQTFFIWCNRIVQICWIWKLKYQLRHSTQDHLKLSFIFIYIYSPIKQTTKHTYNTHPPLIHKLQMQAVQTQFHKKKAWVLYLKDQYDFISGVHPSGRKSIFVINFVSVCRRHTFKQAHTDTHTFL